MCLSTRVPVIHKLIVRTDPLLLSVASVSPPKPRSGLSGSPQVQMNHVTCHVINL